MNLVLVVDDDPQVLKLLQIVLRAEGIQAVTAQDVSEARELVDRVDMVVLDVMLPGESGLTWLAELGPDRPPVLVLTALSDDATLAAARDAGADAVLVKPFAVLEFLDEVRTMLAEARHRPQGMRD